MDADLRVGVVTRTHGVRGELKVYPTTDSPLRFQELDHVLVKTEKRMHKHEVLSARFFKNLVILKLSGVDSLEAAEALRGAELYISREDGEPLGENEYYIADLMGMEVFDENGARLGVVKDVLSTGANDVYIVKREAGKDLLLPAIHDCIKKIDVEEKRMDVFLMPGLLEL